MKDKSKILPRIIIIALVVALISTVVLSAVYAKYVSKDDANASARPAVFELVMNSPRDEAIEFNFAVDGEPGAPIGYTEAKKSFDFSVKTSASEVSAEYFVTVDFNSKITAMINKAREICGKECEITVDTVNEHYWNYKINPRQLDKSWGECIYTDFNNFLQGSLKICVEISLVSETVLSTLRFAVCLIKYPLYGISIIICGLFINLKRYCLIYSSASIFFLV
jgi:hypothetical protein